MFTTTPANVSLTYNYTSMYVPPLVSIWCVLDLILGGRGSKGHDTLFTVRTAVTGILMDTLGAFFLGGGGGCWREVSLRWTSIFSKGSPNLTSHWLDKTLHIPLLKFFFFSGLDIWSDSSSLEGNSDYCVHTEEPYLQTLLYNSFNSDNLTAPLLELTDRLWER